MSDRPQDLHEEVANSALHGAALVGACLAVPQLLQSAPAAHPAALWGVLVFGATMALLYGASTLYHALPLGRASNGCYGSSTRRSTCPLRAASPRLR